MKEKSLDQSPRLHAFSEYHDRIRMKDSIKTLFADYPFMNINGDTGIRIDHIITDSRRIIPGSLFFALPGLNTDGSLYVDEAVQRGAAAVVSEASLVKAHPNITTIQVESCRDALAIVASRFYGHADRDVRLTGVTGTNGKTTVSYLIQYLLEKTSGEVGMLGTIHYDLGKRTLPAYKTTPESVDIHSMLKQMHDAGCCECVMEVSSHALDQDRVKNLKIDTGVFLNLSQDHIDYHGDMDCYFAVKARMFTGEAGNVPASAVINIDDPYGRRLLDLIPADTKVITYGCDEDADIKASSIELDDKGSRFELSWPEGKGCVFSTLPGKYNVSNVLAAMAVVYVHGVDLSGMLNTIKSFPGVPGRMERVDEGQPFQVYVDYAHTDDALRHALEMQRDITKGRLLVVFGCGGNRDKDKRPKMASAVEAFADRVWVTSDNPRREPVEEIFRDISKGIKDPSIFDFVMERKRAISIAVECAEEDDCVVIAGKGHETFQEFADTVLPFDDREAVRDCIRMKYARLG